MFFDDPSQIPAIAARTSCTIFVVPATTKIKLPQALVLEPTDPKKNNFIGVEQIREFIALANNKETRERYFIIRPADAMNEAAENAFLKTFEEPKPHCHFVLFTEHPAALLPTILSRAQVFYLRSRGQLEATPEANAQTLILAKQLIAASDRDLPALADQIAKMRPSARECALDITAAAIELLYKSYFKTKNEKFLAKLPNFLQLYENLSDNGHIKLHLVADLL